jgi:parallel beta-helix repeat protein
MLRCRINDPIGLDIRRIVSRRARETTFHASLSRHSKRAASGEQAMATFYVSTLGSDNADGRSLATAFRTIEQAQSAMRASAGEDTVLVRGGTYEFKTPLYVRAEDAGSHFKAYGSEKVVLSGGTGVTGWTKGADGIWTAKLKVTDLNSITLDGVAQTEARYPNEVPSDPLKGGWLFAKESAAITNPLKQIAFNPADFKPGDLAVGMKVEIFTDLGYGSNRLTIASVDRTKNIITFKEEADFELGAKSRFFVESGKAHLDKTGEWWFDKATETLHFKAPEGFAGKGVVASGNDSIIDIEDVSNVSFEGFSFRDAVTSAHSSDFYTAAIAIRNSHDIVIAKNSFEDLGKGVRVADEAYGVTIKDNDFRHIWSAAIDLEQATHSNVVTGNDIRFTGETFVYRGAIALNESGRNIIRENFIMDVPRMAIHSTNYDPNIPSGGNRIESNIILRSMQATPDGGAIYTYSNPDRAHAGDIIRYNRIFDAGGLETEAGRFVPGRQYSNGIYMDDFTSRAVIESNFVQGTVRGGIYLHGGSNNTVRNNIVIENKDIGIQFFAIGTPMLNNRVTGNIVEMPYAQYGAIMEADPRFIAGTSTSGNYFYNPNGLPLRFNYTLDFTQWKALGYDAGSRLAPNAIFVNPAAGDFRLIDAAKAAMPGFTELPWADMNRFRDFTITTGTLQRDDLIGGAGKDILDGGSGNDALRGLAGNDQLFGAEGDDRLSAGYGLDQMTGGTGRDIFFFTYGLNGQTNTDRITDFVTGTDRIGLEDAIFTSAGPKGVLAASAFVKGTRALDASDRIIFNPATGEVFYDSDGTGTAAQTRFAVIENHAPITFADFLIY